MSKILCIPALALALLSCPVHALLIVAPGAADPIGGFGEDIPFNVVGSGVRYQQRYDASEFSSVTGPIEISEIAFRPFLGGSAFSVTIPGVEISLSTFTNPFLVPTYADNVGSDVTIVFSGDLALSSAYTGPPGGPKDFDIVISFMTPFVYDPSAGDLLLDILNATPGPTSPGVPELHATGGSSLMRVWGAPATGSLGGGDAISLVTQFTFTSATNETPTPVPEPTTLSLLAAAGLVGFGLPRRRRSRAR